MNASEAKRAKIIADEALREQETKKVRGESPDAPRQNWAASAARRSPFKFRKPREG